VHVALAIDLLLALALVASAVAEWRCARRLTRDELPGRQ
jgi:hypothetical protein